MPPSPVTAPARLARALPRYLRDREARHAAVVTLVVVLLSGGLVWLGNLAYVCWIAARSPLAPPRGWITLVFGCRLQHDAPTTPAACVGCCG